MLFLLSCAAPSADTAVPTGDPRDSAGDDTATVSQEGACDAPVDALAYTTLALPFTTVDSDGERFEHSPAALADFDGDGDDDLVVGIRLEGIVYAGNEAGSFPSASKLSPLDHVSSLAVGDLDGDGDLDILAGNTTGRSALFRNEGGQFTEEIDPIGISQLRVRQLGLGDADGDGDLDVYVAASSNGSTRDQLFFNDGTGAFTDESARVPVDSDDGLGWMGIWLDYDQDGDDDHYTLNADQNAGPCSRMLQNDGTAQFTDVTDACGCGYQGSPMGASVGDVDGDAWPDLFITNSGLTLLYQNARDGTFFDAAAAMNAATWAGTGSMSFGSQWFDAENDGDDDILVSTGPFYGGADGSQPAEQVDRFLFRDGDQFDDAAPALGFDDVGAGRAVATGLVDDDATLDVLVTNLGTESYLRTASCNGNGVLVVDLEGAGANTFGVGARVTVTDTAGVARARWNLSASGWGAYTHPRVHVGTGSARPATVRVDWPGGGTTEVDVEPGTWRVSVAE